MNAFEWVERGIETATESLAENYLKELEELRAKGCTALEYLGAAQAFRRAIEDAKPKIRKLLEEHHQRAARGEPPQGQVFH